MKIIKFFLVVSMFSLTILPNAKAEINWSQGGSPGTGFCVFKCNSGATSCPENYAQNSAGGCASNDVSFSQCSDAATSKCGSGNFFHTWVANSGKFDPNRYQILEVTDPEGNVYEGDDAVNYLDRKFNSAGKTK